MLFNFLVPGISESLANTLKQKELLMERIKQYKEISKRPMKSSPIPRKEPVVDSKLDIRKVSLYFNICFVYFSSLLSKVIYIEVYNKWDLLCCNIFFKYFYTYIVTKEGTY